MLVRLKCSMVRGRVTLHEGDVAEVDDARAARLVAAGLAERVDEPAAAVVVETAAVAIPATVETATNRAGGRRRERGSYNRAGR